MSDYWDLVDLARHEEADKESHWHIVGETIEEEDSLDTTEVTCCGIIVAIEDWAVQTVLAATMPDGVNPSGLLLCAECLAVYLEEE
jgi:hypothetical protein